ncbi:MAG: O-antigen ligase family protein [Burkholderiales bacterium]|nr:O-antigen ligase family protein [Burkholderiales bacterium]
MTAAPPHAPLSASGELLRRATVALLWCVMLVPLASSGAALFPVQSAKGFAARVVIELAALCWFALVLREPRFRPRACLISWAVLAYCAVALLAAAAGVDAYRSFWGNLARMNGVFALLHGALLFAIAHAVLRTRADWLRLFEVSLATSAVVAAYALHEALTIAASASTLPVRVRPLATLGHPDLLATYALFQVFFAGFVLAWERMRWMRLVAFTLLGVNVVVLAVAASRGAWVGLYVALACGAGALAVYARGMRRAAAAAALAALLVLPLAIRALHGTELLAAMPHIVQRLAGSSLADPSIRTRLRSVSISAAAWAERPVLGWGPEHYRVAFDRHYDPSAPELEQWFDHAHNKIADVAVETGLTGTIAYLALFATAGIGLARYVRRSTAPSDKAVGATALMLGIAYFVQNLFLFDTPVSQLLFFLLLAFAAFLAGRVAPTPRRAYAPAGWSAGRTVAVAGAGIAVVATLVWANALPYAAAVAGRRALAAQTPAEAVSAFRQALAHAGFTRAEITRAMEDEFIDSGRARSPQWTGLFDVLRSEVEAVLAREPTDVRAFLRAANLYNERSALDTRSLRDAERMSRAAIALSPSRPEAYYELGVTHLTARDYGRARELFERVAALHDGIAWVAWGRALALLGTGSREEGQAALDRALALGADWDTQPEVYVLTHAFVAAQPAAGLVPLYERVVAARPGVARYRVMLATAYASAGDPRQAREHARAAAALDPSYAADARRFIEALPAE